MARMTQTEVISSLADSCGCKKSQVKAMFDALTELATKEVRSNGEFTVPGFGKLKKTNRKARQGRNPATGAVIGAVSVFADCADRNFSNCLADARVAVLRASPTNWLYATAAIAASTPMMITTTMSSMSVKPLSDLRRDM